MIHEEKILWHDILEDPEDLPKEYGRYLITMVEKIDTSVYSGETKMLDSVSVYRIRDDGYFDRSLKTWMVPDDEGPTRNIIGKNDFANIQVIAWAEPVRPYRPGKGVEINEP